MTAPSFLGLCWKQLKAIWLWFEWLTERIAVFHAFLLQLATLCLLAAFVGMLWLVLSDPNPVDSDRVLSVTPASRYLDRSRSNDFRVLREICVKRAGQTEVLRAWTEMTRDDSARPIVVFSAFYYSLQKGCHEVNLVQAVPDALPPGRYVYEAMIRSCNVINRCFMHRLVPIPVTVVGGNWPDVDIAMPPPLGVPPALPSRPAIVPEGFAR